MIDYVKHFDGNKTMSFKVIDSKLLKKCTKIWKKINNLIGKAFGKEPVYGDSNKYINTKIKSYEGNVNTNLQGKKVPKKMHT